MRPSLDSNVLIYSVDTANRAKQSRAIEIVRRAAGVALGAVAEQCLFEFVHVSMRKLRMPREQALQIMRGFVQQFDIILPPNDIVEATANTLAAYKLSIWDARLPSVCNAAAVDTLFSEDLQDGGRYGSVTVVNPFEPSNFSLIDKLLPP